MTAFQTFLEKIKQGILAHYGDSCQVEINKIKKNNGVSFCGLTITDGEANIAPTIYMEGLYREYQEGKPLCRILEKVIDIYESHKPEGRVELSFLLEFDKVRERILYRLVHYERNEEELSKIPHIRFLDMAVVFYCSIQHPLFGNASVLISKNLCTLWKVEEEELAGLARQNTPRLLPAGISDMMQVLGEAVPADILAEEGRMYILTNGQRLFGAACILYPALLQRFAARIGDSFYILPSSVHEVLLLPQKKVFGKEALEEIVKEVNRTQLAPEEVLSDTVYFYDRERQEIRML